MEKSANTGKIVGALLLGATVGGVIGTALGFLFAPHKGSKTRKQLMAKGGHLSNGLKLKFVEFVDEVKREVGTATEKMTELVDNGITKIEKIK